MLFNFGWSNNLFMKGLPYVAIGYFLSKNYDTLIGKTKSAIILYSLSSIIMIIFIHMIIMTYSVYIQFKLFAYLLFLYIL